MRDGFGVDTEAGIVGLLPAPIYWLIRDLHNGFAKWTLCQAAGCYLIAAMTKLVVRQCWWLSTLWALGAIQDVCAEVKMPAVFGEHMILQRGKPVPVYGSAVAGEKITVTFHGQSLATTTNPRGVWQLKLAAMSADPNGQPLTVRGSNTLTFNDVLVGDVWLCSGQSNMDMRLGGCERPADVAGAAYPGIRQFLSPAGSWKECTPASAAEFSGVAFYFARKIYQDQQEKIPIGLMLAAMGGTKIDLWLAPDGLIDIPVLHPLYHQTGVPGGPFSLFEKLIKPLVPYGIKGAIWYQGENSELAAQSPDSYYLKMKALALGWQRVWGLDELAFYPVIIANWGELPKGPAPEMFKGGWDADTRLQQANAMALPHAGCASALDIGDSSMGDKIWQGWHPKDKLDVGERLALWALKNDYGRPQLEASGPTLKEVGLVGGTVVCSFDHLGNGLMVGSKKWYEPTREMASGKLRCFVIAGADGVWHAADAVIKGATVVLSSPQVRAPRKVSYACWQNPEGCNLYNKDGLPAAPFHVEDVTQHLSITAAAGDGGEISPSGSRNYPKRKATLYHITPKTGYFIQDVKVDGVSVGSVRSYTFDPIDASHTIAASFAKTAPKYTISASASGGGTLTPAGAVSVAQGEAATFSIAANGDNQVEVTVDGVCLGARSQVIFSDVRSNHTLAIAFCGTIKASAGFGGTITPDGALPVSYGASQTFTVAPLAGYAISSINVDGVNVATANSYTFPKVTASHTIVANFKNTAKALRVGAVPKPERLLIACRAEALPAKGDLTSWPSYLPAGKPMKPIGTPALDTIDGHPYAKVSYETGDGFSAGTYPSPIACEGASIVVVAKPMRNGAGSGWTSIVDVFYDRLVLGIRNDSGLVCVRRNGGVDTGSKSIPDGQITILSLIVQPDGAYKVFANGSEVMSNPTKNAMTSLVPGAAGPFATSITVGRNAPDGWSAFNGAIGDVFAYTTALSDADRQQLEAWIANSLTSDKPKP